MNSRDHQIHTVTRAVDSLIMRWVFMILFCMYFIPVVFQLFYIFSAPSRWFEIGQMTIVEKDGQQLLQVPRKVNSPLLLQIVWEVHDVDTGHPLCTRATTTTYEKTDPTAQADLRLLLRTCDQDVLQNRKLELQAHFVHTLNYGIKKEQIVVTEPFYLK